jgi:2-dehydro-3-deoxy-D-arabinonate dehydratase
VRFASIWDPGAGAPRLCALEDRRLWPVGSYRDVAELVAAAPGLSLTDAAEAIGMGDAAATWDEIEHAPIHEAFAHLLPPVRPAEVWAAGVTYERSRDARTLESGRLDVYERVYEAERPELFLKATAARVVGPNAAIGVRGDSAWQVPEPELALVLAADGAVLGYTIGNDVSSRDIEGENPLYLPQAKIFAGSCALGPVVVTSNEIADPYDLAIGVRIERAGETIFDGATSTARLHTRLDTLTAYLARENWLAPATVLLTGTGVVPPDEFTLAPGDVVEIACPAIGTLRNTCAAAAQLAPPPGWGYAGSR